MRLIKLTPAASGHSESPEDSFIIVNTMKIIMVLETHENERGNSRVVLDNGKSLYVDESQDDVMDMANEFEGGGGGGGLGSVVGGKLGL